MQEKNRELMWNSMHKFSSSTIRNSRALSLLSQSIKQPLIVTVECAQYQNVRLKTTNNGSISSYFKPIPIKAQQSKENENNNYAKQINKAELVQILNQFSKEQSIKARCKENDLDG